MGVLPDEATGLSSFLNEDLLCKLWGNTALNHPIDCNETIPMLVYLADCLPW